jgi:hypothetical protein
VAAQAKTARRVNRLAAGVAGGVGVDGEVP